MRDIKTVTVEEMTIVFRNQPLGFGIVSVDIQEAIHCVERNGAGCKNQSPIHLRITDLILKYLLVWDNGSVRFRERCPNCVICGGTGIETMYGSEKGLTAVYCSKHAKRFNEIFFAEYKTNDALNANPQNAIKLFNKILSEYQNDGMKKPQSPPLIEEKKIIKAPQQTQKGEPKWLLERERMIAFATEELNRPHFKKNKLYGER